MRRAYSSLASFGSVNINQFVAFIVIGVLSLAVGLWIPNDGGALAVALAAVTIGVVAGVPVWSVAAQRRQRQGAVGHGPVSQPLKSRAYLVPRELPPGPADFVGRTVELRRLEEALRRAGNADPFIAVIYGPPGIGKSALAVTFAHKVARLFPDGQLFVPMRAATRWAGTTEDLIEYFVAALRSPEDSTPADAGGWGEEYLKLTKSRSVLFVLDDIPADLDITALRPASPTCAFIATCREEPDWPAVSCERLVLTELEESEALDMLRVVIGADRVAKEEEPSRGLASLCGHQPQALRAAGTAVANRPDWDIRLILEQAESALTRETHERLGGGTFDAVYALLTTEEQRALRALGVLQRSNFMPWMLAAALGTTEDRGRRLASRLADAGLIERYNPGSGTPSYLAEGPVLDYAFMRVTDHDSADTIRRRLEMAEQSRRDESLDTLDELLEHNGGFTPAIDKVRSAMTSAQERRGRTREAEACAALAELYADLGDMIAAEELANRALGLGGGHSGARAHRCMVRIERRRHQLVTITGAVAHLRLRPRVPSFPAKGNIPFFRGRARELEELERRHQQGRANAAGPAAREARSCWRSTVALGWARRPWRSSLRSGSPVNTPTDCSTRTWVPVGGPDHRATSSIRYCWSCNGRRRRCAARPRRS